MHVAVRRDGERVLYLAYDVESHEQRRRDGAAILLVSVMAATLGGMLAARGLAGRLPRDLERLAGAVRGRVGAPRADGPQTGQDDTVAFSPLAEHTETLTLARALDEEHARVRAAIARERAFAAAANHELRTPLMQASSTLELLESASDDAARQALTRRLAAAHAELRVLTEALLRVARGRTAESARDCALDTIVCGVVERTADDARVRRIEVVDRLPAGTRARVDPGSLEIVLLNLVRNAIRHSGGRRVEIGLDSGALCVDDDGGGPGQGQGYGRDHGPAPAFAIARPAGAGPSAGGDGLGLSIVERVCEANGWRARIAPRAGGGTRACVTLEAPIG